MYFKRHEYLRPCRIPSFLELPDDVLWLIGQAIVKNHYQQKFNDMLQRSLSTTGGVWHTSIPYNMPPEILVTLGENKEKGINCWHFRRFPIYTDDLRPIKNEHRDFVLFEFMNKKMKMRLMMQYRSQVQSTDIPKHDFYMDIHLRNALGEDGVRDFARASQTFVSILFLTKMDDSWIRKELFKRACQTVDSIDNRHESIKFKYEPSEEFVNSMINLISNGTKWLKRAWTPFSSEGKIVKACVKAWNDELPHVY